MLNVGLCGETSAYRAAFFLGQLVSDDVTKLVFVCRSLHEPVAVDAEHVEAVEAIIDPDKISPVSEPLRFQIFLAVSEGLKADGAATAERIVVLADELTQVLVHLIEEAVNLTGLLLVVAVL